MTNGGDGTCALGPWGHAIGEDRLSSAEIATRLGVPCEWIRERTGIDSRAVGRSTSALAVAAGRDALVGATGPVDLVIVATTTPDHLIPATAPAVASALGLTCGAFDLNAACAGFVYALLLAARLAECGSTSTLVIGADAMRSVVDDDDRDTSILFGDAAAAVVVQPGDAVTVLGTDTGSDGSLVEILHAPHGGRMVMSGREVFRRAVQAAVASGARALECSGLNADDIDRFVPHQANARIVTAIAAGLGIPMERTVVDLADVGNTSSASVPLALARGTQPVPGETVLLAGFGAGMTWASAVLRWR